VTLLEVIPSYEYLNIYKNQANKQPSISPF